MRGILWGAGAVLVFTAGVAAPACSSDGSFEDYTRPGYTDGTCGVNQAPTCFDMVQNGAEQGVDCGEGCQLACPVQSPPG